MTRSRAPVRRRLAFASALSSALSSVLIPAACATNPAARVAGTYVLDGEAAVRSLHTFVRSTMPERYASGREGDVHVHDLRPRSMTGTLELRTDGTMELAQTTDGVPAAPVRGTWRVDGDRITVEAARRGGARDGLTFLRTGDTLTTTLGAAGENAPVLVFVRR
jgi:hypothetical protein